MWRFLAHILLIVAVVVQGAGVAFAAHQHQHAADAVGHTDAAEPCGHAHGKAPAVPERKPAPAHGDCDFCLILSSKHLVLATSTPAVTCASVWSPVVGPRSVAPQAHVLRSALPRGPPAA